MMTEAEAKAAAEVWAEVLAAASAEAKAAAAAAATAAAAAAATAAAAADQRRLVLIGDTIIDINTYGRILGVSAETPTLVMQVLKETETRGGAAFVATNLLELSRPGPPPRPPSRPPFRPRSFTFLSNENTAGCVTKQRYWVEGCKLLQVDRLPPENPLDESALKALDIRGGLVIFSDYRHGLLTEKFVRWAIPYCRERGCTTMVDSQVSQQPGNHGWYSGADYLFVNSREYAGLAGPGLDSLRWPLDNFRSIIVKMGKDGAVILPAYHTAKGIPVDVADTCGAGDAFLAAFAAFHHLGDAEALRRANIWAAAKCALPGTVPPKYAEVFGDE
jgi:bifunctional ADP-heptose synthase (sugar kinase/adenylyltransferase)